MDLSPSDKGLIVAGFLFQMLQCFPFLGFYPYIALLYRLNYSFVSKLL